MLMALLPFAVSAATLDPSKFTAKNLDYGTAAFPADEVNAAGYNPGEHYTVVTDKFYTSDTGEGETAIGSLATASVGKYYIKINGAGDYIGQTIYVDFWINGIAIGAANIEDIDDQTYNGSQIKPAVVVKNGTTTLTLNTDYTVTYGANKNAGDDAGSVTIKGKGNYSGEGTKTFNISKKTFNADNITVTVAASSFVYNKAGQAPEVTVTDKTLGQLTAGTDYTITYDDNAAKPINAKDNIQIKVTGMGNYSANNIATDAMKYNIAQATLLVTPNIEKIYDGTAALPGLTLDMFTFQGFQGNDTKAVVDGFTPAGAAVRTGSDKTKTTVGTYEAESDPTKFTAGGGNYKFAKNTGTFKINKKATNISVANKLNVTYGTPDSEIEYTLTVSAPISEAEGTAIKKATKVTRAATANGDGHYALTLSKKDDAAAADLAVLANYEPTYVTGNYLTYAKGELVIAIDESKVTLTKEYDGAVPTIPALTLDDLIVSGLANGDTKENLTIPTAEIVSASKNVDTYQVKLTGAAYPGDKYNISTVNSQYKITKAPLTITIKQQSAKAGDPIAKAFDATLFTVEGLKDPDTQNGIFELQLADAAKDGVNIKNVASGDYILLAVKGGKEAAAANYSGFEGKKAKLTIVPATSILLSDAEDLSKLNAQADANVAFSSRELKQGVWTTMVLPFATTVRQVSNALGYAIVDMLDTDEESSDMNFKIHMGAIPAYTPFLVKVDEDINMNEVLFETAGDVHVNIVKFEGEVAKNLTQSNKDYNFIGKLDLAAIGSDFWAVGSKMTKDDFKFNKYAAGKKVAPMRAYITAKPGVSAAPTIYIEEADGTVTAINAISADGVAIEKANAEGWYTLQGVKLDSAPTQKGIYIYNGKKIAIK